MTAPCRDCADRQPGCHDVCAKYAAFREDRARIREARQEENDFFAMRKAALMKWERIRLNKAKRKG